MRGLSDFDLLTIWSSAQAVHPAARGAVLLRAGTTGTSLDELMRLPVGRRDARLIALREQWLGHTLAVVTSCPACGLRLEADVPTTALAGANDGMAKPSPIAFRLPDTRDLVAIAAAPDEETARAMLLRRCVNDGVDPLQLPPDIVAGVIAAIAAADPGGDVTIGLTCPDCGHTWESALDIAAFLWKEIDAAARRTLVEVHALATAYGWSEQEILSIPAVRRQNYLAMVWE